MRCWVQYWPPGVDFSEVCNVLARVTLCARAIGSSELWGPHSSMIHYRSKFVLEIATISHVLASAFSVHFAQMVPRICLF